jgi:hypothetical protein
MERPNVSCGDVNVEMVFKRAYDVHDIEGIEFQILNKIRIISHMLFAGDLEDDFLHEFQHGGPP